MNGEFIKVEVFFTNDSSLEIKCPQLNECKLWSYPVIKNNEEIENIFNRLAELEILSCFEKGNDRTLYVCSNEKKKYKFVLKQYRKILYYSKCTRLDQKMEQYWFNKAIKAIQAKLKANISNLMKKTPTKLVIAGSLLTATTTIMIQSISIPNNSIKDVNTPINITEEVSIDEETTETTEIVINEEETNITTNLPQSENPEIETLIIDENNSTSGGNDYIQNNNSQNNSSINFSELANFTSPTEYISFASNLYGVDIETANVLLRDKINNMEQYINNSNNAELKNLYELKKLGVINGDLDVMGIFVIIKNYAIDNLNLDNQEPIISNKTASEKEKDIIDIARYIYGIENKEILDIIITIHRLEASHGNSPYAIKLNNLGGNMNANPSQEQIDRFIRIIEPKEINIEENPIPNIYKTTEIGEESMVRNFLNIYAKCLRDAECLNKNNIPDFLSKKYCTHTPEAWAEVIKEMLNEGTIQETVESYIDGNGKIL